MHPILFELHGLRIGTYGLFAATGLALGLLLFSWLASRDGWQRLEIAYLGTCAFLVGLFASKLVGLAVEYVDPAELDFWLALDISDETIELTDLKTPEQSSSG